MCDVIVDVSFDDANKHAINVGVIQMKAVFIFASVLMGGAACAPVWAQDGEVALRAQGIANTLCVTCHGTNGNSVVENYPSLAGQKAPYLEKQMMAFRSGTRLDPVMPNMLASLDEPVIKALARHYAEQKSRNRTERPLPQASGWLGR